MKQFLISLLLVLGLAAPVHADDSLYQALGAREGVLALVKDFAQRLKADARIGAQFKDIDQANLHLRLAEQLCMLTGGPCVYRGKDMKLIHDGLDITEAQFNAVVEHLQTAMAARGIANADVNRLLAKLAPMYREIVTK